ncbi:MAG TPA: PQQ-binding-like beta-propeller repeat protein [Bryobacteraceae bacterium]|nr:PQQ-binding-like beta-propeller repeat protein [Bryobacteraceae bacterium]
MRRLSAAVLLCAGALVASSTSSWEMTTFADFARGRLMGLSLDREGRLTLAPRVESLFASGQPAIWSVDQADDGTLFAGTGHRGRVYRIEPDGKGKLLWTAPQPEVFAVAAGREGVVFAGTSPDGRVYRIDKNGQATEYFDPQSKYIWALALGSDDALYVGTGDEGRIYRVSGPGKGELWYETGQAHITALTLDPQGRLLAGSEPNGLLYRIAAKNKAFVLYDANLPEIRTIAVSPEGAIYAAALGGSVAQRTGAAARANQTSGTGTQVTAPVTSITVEGVQGGAEIKPRPTEPPKAPAPAAATAQSTILPGTVVYTAPAQDTGNTVEKSAVYRINVDGTVETLWSSKEENVYDLLLAARNEILFSTDANGRIYRMGADRKATLLAQTNEGETTRLLPSEDFIVAATSTSGKLLKIGAGAAAQGSYESPVHDAGSVSRWGQIDWRGTRAGGGTLLFRTRAGNSARPDKTWSEWSEPLTNPTGSPIVSPSARFVQWRAEMTPGSAGETPAVTGVTLSYLPQNNPPSVRSINVVTQAVSVPAAGRPGGVQQSSGGTYSITVTDTGEPGASSLSGTPTQTMPRSMTQQIHLTWVADDPDGDRLTYSVYFRGEDESRWKPLRLNIAENTFMLEGEVLADGKYLFRIVASDRQSNAAGSARDSELISPPVLFDNTPPAVRASAVRKGTIVELSAEAEDGTSSLRKAEYSLNAAAWIPLEPADGVADGRRERWTASIDNIPAGEHLIVVRVWDAANNAGLTRVLLQ